MADLEVVASHTDVTGTATQVTYTVTNNSGSSFHWWATHQPMLSLDIEHAELASGASVVVTATIDSTLGDGDHTTLVSFATPWVFTLPVIHHLHTLVNSRPAQVGTTYYVDFDAGSDAADGLTTGTAWKHHPGDISATGNSASKTPAVGERYLFKGGVSYRGQIDTSSAWGGTIAAPVVLDGNSRNEWGTGQAILDGADTPIASGSWTNEGGGVYSATIPAGLEAFDVNLCTGDRQMFLSQGPDKPSKVTSYHSVAQMTTVAETDIDDTTITDTVFSTLTTANANWWVDAYVAVWVQGNRVYDYPITGVVGDVLTYNNTNSRNTYTDRDGAYSIINSSEYMLVAGDYYVDATANKVYCIPYQVSDITNELIVFSSPDYNKGVFFTSSAENINVKSFRILRHSTAATSGGVGISKTGTGQYTGNLNVDSCELGLYRAKANAAGDIVSGACSFSTESFDSSFVGNAVSQLINARCFNIGGAAQNHTDFNCSYNLFYASSESGGLSQSNDDMIFKGNHILGLDGAHANGFAIYNDTNAPIIEDCVILGGLIPITIQDCQNPIIRRNILESIGSGSPAIAGFNGSVNGTNGLRCYHNIMIATNYSVSMTFSDSGHGVGGVTYNDNIIRNNVCSDNLPTAIATRLLVDYNIYIDPEPSDGSTGSSSEVATDLFDDYAGWDFHPKDSGPLIDAGIDVGLPFTGASPDIGYIEFVAPTATTSSGYFNNSYFASRYFADEYFSSADAVTANETNFEFNDPSLPPELIDYNIPSKGAISATGTHAKFIPNRDTSGDPAIEWLGDNTGAMSYVEVSGDFFMHTKVDLLELDGTPLLDVNYFAGIIAKDPVDTPSVSALNYVFVTKHFVSGLVPRVESKTTVNSSSTAPGDVSFTTDALIALERVGNNFNTYAKEPADPSWTSLETFVRADLPTVLQIGMISYSFGRYEDTHTDWFAPEFDYLRISGNVLTAEEFNIVLSDSVAVADSLIYEAAYSRAFDDPVTPTDSVSYQATYVRTFNQLVTPTESILAIIAGAPVDYVIDLNDTVEPSESMANQIAVALEDSVALQDSLSVGYSLTFQEALEVADSLKSSRYDFEDQVDVVDSISIEFVSPNINPVRLRGRSISISLIGH